MQRNVSKSYAAKVTMEEHPPSAWRGAVILFGTTLAVAMLDTYTETVAGMLFQGRRLTHAEVHAIWHDVSPVMVGAQVPTLVLLLSALGFFSVERAITIAEVVCVLFLFGYGYRVGQLLHERWFQQLASGLLLVAIGGLIVGIKALVH